MSSRSEVMIGFPRDGVALLTINRPEVRNAFDWAAIDGFRTAVADLAAAAEDPAGELCAVVVTGAGESAFSSGVDLRALRAAVDREDGLRLASSMGDALNALESLPVPVLAAINGHAVGGGAEIALACDLRFVDSSARLGLVHLGLAEVPGWGGGTRLALLVGHARAARMLLEARAYGVDELTTLGLADFVTPAGQALAAALAFADTLARADRAAICAVKRLLIAARTKSPAESLAFERALFADLWPAPAHVAAMRAFGMSNG